MTTQQLILIIDDDPSLQRVLAAALEDEGYRTEVAVDATAGRAALDALAPALVLLDLNLPDASGLDVLADWQAAGIATPVIVITAQNTVENAIKAMQLGAHDYVVKPFDLDDLYKIVAEAINEAPASAQAGVAQPDPGQTHQLVGTGVTMRGVYKTIGRTAKTDATALLIGESGTGKELVARAIHQFSSRRNRPFVAVNTTAIPADLLEAELFGYEKGAFTGAAQASAGKFREADGGTLLLDEIGDMPLSLQAKLLRVLQEREITPLGGRRPVPIDTRIIAATQVPLEQAVDDGRFRADLYYRVKVVQIDLPPLRQRAEDVGPLCAHFLQQMAAKGEIPPKVVQPEAIALMERKSWPGNVRQLENLVRRVALLSPARELTTDMFARHGGEFDEDVVEVAQPQSFSDVIETRLKDYVSAMHEVGETDVWSQVMDTVESVLLRLALQASQGNQLKAASLLGINRNTIRKKLTEHQIEPRAFKSGSPSGTETAAPE